MRLIDADAVISSVKTQTEFVRLFGGGLREIADLMEQGFLQEIENAPTIDAVPVVRCRECKHSTMDGSYVSTEQMNTHLNCRMWLTANRHSTAIVPCDGYCALGQRREEGDA